MNKRMTDLSAIEKIAKQIGTTFKVDRVTLFGSYAYGKPGPDSDVDLLITMRTNRRPIEEAIGIRKSIRFPFPVDLMVRTPDQIKQRLSIGDPFIQDIQERGKVLYEAA
jgi:predicted nucleotidyltransferase